MLLLFPYENGKIPQTRVQYLKHFVFILRLIESSPGSTFPQQTLASIAFGVFFPAVRERSDSNVEGNALCKEIPKSKSDVATVEPHVTENIYWIQLMISCTKDRISC